MNKDARIVFRLPESGVQAVDELAEQEERTRSDMLRRLISEALKARQAKQVRR